MILLFKYSTDEDHFEMNECDVTHVIAFFLFHEYDCYNFLFYAFAILYVLIVMQIRLVVVDT